jgi:hypothetical protein
MDHGHYTAELGERLEDWLKGQNRENFKVYYDHGPKGMSKVVPFFRPHSRASTLAFVDCAVVDTVRQHALVLCEIEEEGASPKKVIGDICNLFLAEALCIGGEEYSFDGIPVILGVCVQEGGLSGVKARELGRRIESLMKPGSPRHLEVRVLPETDCDALVDTVFDEICNVIKGSRSCVSTSNTPEGPRRPCRP